MVINGFDRLKFISEEARILIGCSCYRIRLNCLEAAPIALTALPIVPTEMDLTFNLKLKTNKSSAFRRKKNTIGFMVRF